MRKENIIVSVLILAGMAFSISCSEEETKDTAKDAGSDSNSDSDEGKTEIDWVKIKPGTFIYGSPETEPCRGKYAEDQVQVTLTHPFEMARTEITVAQWKGMGFSNQTPSEECKDCPVVAIDWFEVLEYCNALSRKAGLDTCYELKGCKGILGEGCKDTDKCEEEETYICEYKVHRYDNWYECPGYRLPTAAEWEYAARAGTTTATYNGDVAWVNNSGNNPCSRRQETLDEIAWYSANTVCVDGNDQVKPVAQKKPNQWGLYDMIGNAMEWTDSVFTGWGLEEDEGKEGPLTDPMGSRHEGPDLNARISKSCSVWDSPCLCRTARESFFDVEERTLVVSFRPVRTLFE